MFSATVEHLLVALGDRDIRFLVPYLQRHGKSVKNIIESVKGIRGSSRVDSKDSEEHYQALQKYGTNLTEKAAKGALDPVIGRDDAIRRVVEILSRRT